MKENDKNTSDNSKKNILKIVDIGIKRTNHFSTKYLSL